MDEARIEIVAYRSFKQRSILRDDGEPLPKVQKPDG
jgi:hypothetical protein